MDIIELFYLVMNFVTYFVMKKSYVNKDGKNGVHPKPILTNEIIHIFKYMYVRI
jgi:hypothetical protein